MYKLYLLSILYCCGQIIKSDYKEEANDLIESYILLERLKTPENFNRILTDSSSFGYYLQHLPLKPIDSKVLLYNGETKENNDIYCAVVNMDIGKKDLQQCADACMRLRAEYLYHKKRYKDIQFKFVADNKWHTYLDYIKQDYSYKKFRLYMEYVFNYANTASLKKQLNTVPFYQMEIGDVLVQSVNPYGHAVIIVDICENMKGEKQYMLAQSYMPAQETQILVNPNTLKPWFNKPDGSVINTPEWTFDTADLKRW
ncbi:MAG: hypothetical protein HQ463_08065 [Bacteroidetes bacterium]|nr:hypothetical protein [Bacteroidota bacterium]